MMDSSHLVNVIAVVSALAGAVHVAAPDHWLPSSVLAWRGGWKLRKTVLFGLGLFSLHVLLGLLVYFGFDFLVRQVEPKQSFGFALGLCLAVMALRLIRFSRIRDIFRFGPQSAWGIFSVISLLGPCESMIPILIKSRQMGFGVILPSLTFLVGTWVAGIAFIVFGRYVWNRPFWLPVGLKLTSGRGALWPIGACLVLGLGAILRLP